jgi:NAD(P) transhydrogenase subunit alpha
LASRLPTQSSTLMSNNIVNLLTDLTPQKDGQIVIDTNDVVTRGALVTHHGQITWPPPKIADPSPPKTAQKVDSVTAPENPSISTSTKWLGLGIAAIAAIILLLLIGRYTPPESGFVSHFTVFVLACFVGYQVIWNVTPALHTPLMSVTNAISGIIIIGGMLQIIKPAYSPSTVLGAIAVLIAMINVAGGFFVTQRMLGMFRKD